MTDHNENSFEGRPGNRIPLPSEGVRGKNEQLGPRGEQAKVLPTDGRLPGS